MSVQTAARPAIIDVGGQPVFIPTGTEVQADITPARREEVEREINEFLDSRAETD